jgi:UDP:flavonoid glycosyltransferase YjiC (YdhE family)
MFAVYPAHAHLYPLVPCAWALQSAGHDVRVASYSGFSKTIAATGLTPVALGTPGAPEARFAEGSEIPDRSQVLDRYAEIMRLGPAERDSWEVFYQFMLLACGDYLGTDRPEVADIMAFTRNWRPDLVIWDPTFPVAALAARACGAAHARFLHGPDIFGWHMKRLAAYRDELRAAGLDEDPFGTLVRPTAEHYGLEVDDELIAGQWSIDPMPEELRLDTGLKLVPMQYVPFAGAVAVPDWLRAPQARPRIVVSLGVSTRQAMAGSHVRDEIVDGELPAAGQGSADPVRHNIRMDAEQRRISMFLDAVATMDVDVVATLNQAQLDGLSIPGNVRVISYVPLPLLLRTSAALAHHGGLGTMAAASVLGVPQLIFDTGGSNKLATVEHADGSVEVVLPDKKMEATYVADYVIRRHAGGRLNHKAQTVAEMRDLLEQVLTDASYREGAAALSQAWLTLPTPNEIVPTLEKLTARHQGTLNR